MKKKTAIIVNPISGMGRQKKIETLLKDNLNQDLFDYTVRYTERIHHGTDLAREAVDQGYDCVVAVGGDGSVNDVAQGIKDSAPAARPRAVSRPLSLRAGKARTARAGTTI